MKKYLTTALVGFSLAIPAMTFADDVATEAKTETEAAAPVENYQTRLSYSMGYEMGSYLKSIGGDITEADLVKGVHDAFSGAKAALSNEEMMQVKMEFAKKMQEKQRKQFEEMKTKNIAEGKAYLEKNKAKEGVVVTKSGLQYEVLKEGSGDKATASDTVSVKYKGTLIDGTEFDSTEKQGDKPIEFKVDQVIAGWTEALQLMNPGTKLHLVIPADLAYGEQGAPPMIEPNSVLIFDVELLDIKKAGVEAKPVEIKQENPAKKNNAEVEKSAKEQAAELTEEVKKAGE